MQVCSFLIISVLPEKLRSNYTQKDSISNFFYFIFIGNWTRFNLASSLPLQKLALLLIIRLSMNTPECPWSWAERTSPWRERGGGEEKCFPPRMYFSWYLSISVSQWDTIRTVKQRKAVRTWRLPSRLPLLPVFPFIVGPHQRRRRDCVCKHLVMLTWAPWQKRDALH